MMIDTVVLIFKEEMFKVTNPRLFHPSADELYRLNPHQYGSQAFFKCTQNLSKIDKLNGIYKPRLTLTRRNRRHRGTEITLKVELSLPKLIFGNNFDELEDDDFDLVIQKLLNTLSQMGISTTLAHLNNVSVPAIHFGKNIVLTDYTTPSTYIQELKRCDIPINKDINETNYRNGGLSWKIHTNSFELAIYDKKADLEQAGLSEKRSEERDNQYQLNLFEDKQTHQPFEVIRIEVRINRKQSLKKLLRQCNLPTNCTLEKLFGQNTSKTILLNQLSYLRSKLIPPSKNSTASSTYVSLIKDNPDIKPKTALQLTAVKLLISELGTRETRQLLKPHGNRLWYSIKKDLEKANTSNPTNALNLLEQKLTAYERVRLKNYPDIM